MQACSRFNDDQICDARIPVISNKFISCEFDLYLQKINGSRCTTKSTDRFQFWKWLDDKWVFSIPSNTSIQVTCNHSATEIALSRSGFISILHPSAFPQMTHNCLYMISKRITLQLTSTLVISIRAGGKDHIWKLN